jgi:hypothetical protein
MSAPVGGPVDRPDFMAVLGLLPPYTIDDVKAAYRTKVWNAHPDRGGKAADFKKIEDAYQQAVEYVTFRGDRRGWIASQVDTYLRQQEIAAEVGRRGGAVEYEQTKWLQGSFGDGFAMLAERLRVIRLRGPTADDAFLAYLDEQPRRTPYLIELDLAGGQITDRGLHHLAGFEVLRRLNLAGTAVTGHGLRTVLRSLPSLEWLNVAGTKIGWWSRWRLGRAHPRLRITAKSDAASGQSDGPSR